MFHKELWVGKDPHKVPLLTLSRRFCGWKCQQIHTLMYVFMCDICIGYSYSTMTPLIILLAVFVQFNFIGRLLGPRGNSLKRIEASTGCRVFIRGKGSIKDSGKVSATLEIS